MVGGLLVLVAGVAALTPIHFHLRARGAQALAWDGEVAWVWGIARMQVRGEGASAKPPQLLLLGRAVRLPRPAPRTRPRVQGWTRPTRLLRALPRLAAALHIRLGGEVRLGCADPAVTGMVAALAASGVLGSGVLIGPDFVSPGFRGDLALHGWCLPGAVALITISALWRAGLAGRPLHSAPRGWMT